MIGAVAMLLVALVAVKMSGVLSSPDEEKGRGTQRYDL